MQARWFSHLPSSQQEDFKKLVLGSHKVLDKLLDLCYTTIQNAELTKLDDYESPSWSHRQADRNGYLRAYREMADLVDLSKSSDKDRK